MPTVLSRWLWNEHGLRWSNAHFVPFCARSQWSISCHFSAFCRRDSVSLYTLVNAHNKCNSKYTMRSTTRMQVLELWPIKCGTFCARTRRKAVTWMQEEEYSEWMMRLHWINISNLKVLRKQLFSICFPPANWFMQISLQSLYDKYEHLLCMISSRNLFALITYLTSYGQKIVQK
jgi:hypothetical protein